MAKMENKRLGRTGLYVSEICLGAMTFGSKEMNTWGMPTSGEEESVKIMNAFVEKGGNFIDTANVYGDSEEVIGRWMTTKRRDELVIATKVRGMMGPGPNDQGLSRKHIMSAVDSSLKKLQTPFIDLYQVHTWDTDTPLKETFGALNDLVRVGKIRYIGISNFAGHQLQKIVDLSREMGWEDIVCLQPQYNLLCRSTEWDLLPICQYEGIGVIPWSPLAGGWLSGKYKRGEKQPAQGSRVEWAEKIKWKHTDWSTKNDEHTWSVLDAVNKVAKEANKSVAQVSLRWLIQKPGVTCPIIGAKTVSQLEDNLGCLGWSLTAEQMAELDAASAVPIPYPWGEDYQYSRRRNFNIKK